MCARIEARVTASLVERGGGRPVFGRLRHAQPAHRSAFAPLDRFRLGNVVVREPGLIREPRDEAERTILPRSSVIGRVTTTAIG